MKDFLSKEISIGDIVVTTDPNYNEMRKAKVLRITPKMVILEVISAPSHYTNKGREFKRFPTQIVVIEKFFNYGESYREYEKA